MNLSRSHTLTTQPHAARGRRNSPSAVRTVSELAFYSTTLLLLPLILKNLPGHSELRIVFESIQGGVVESGLVRDLFVLGVYSAREEDLVRSQADR